MTYGYVDEDDEHYEYYLEEVDQLLAQHSIGSQTSYKRDDAGLEQSSSLDEEENQQAMEMLL